jgi:hypothetical protein
MNYVYLTIGALVLFLLVYIQYWSVRYQDKKAIMSSLALAILACLTMVPNSDLLSTSNYKIITFVIGLTLGVVIFNLCNDFLESKKQEILLSANNAIVLGLFLSVWNSLGVTFGLKSLGYLSLGYLTAYVLVFLVIMAIANIQEKIKRKKPA